MTLLEGMQLRMQLFNGDFLGGFKSPFLRWSKLLPGWRWPLNIILLLLLLLRHSGWRCRLLRVPPAAVSLDDCESWWWNSFMLLLLLLLLLPSGVGESELSAVEVKVGSF